MVSDTRRHDSVDRKQSSRDRWEGMKRWTRYWYLRLMRQNSSPKNLAAAMALGMFIGSMPIIPFQSVVVIALAFVFRVNKLAAWLATCYSNAFTMVPFYYFLYKVGDVVTPFEGVAFDPSMLEMEKMIESGWDVFLLMLAGGFAFGVPASVATYFLSLVIIRRYRERRALRLLRKRTGV